MIAKPLVWVLWYEMPTYGAVILNHLALSYNIKLFTTQPKFDFKYELRSNIKVIESADLESLQLPTLLISCGPFTKYLKSVRKYISTQNIPILDMADNNNNEGNFKVFLKYIRSLFNKKVSYLMVPGVSGFKLAKRLRVKNVFTGMYASAPKLTKNEIECITNKKRKNVIVYIGQLSNRKNVKKLCEVFVEVDNSNWELQIIGDGPLRSKLPKHKNIEYLGFLQRDQILAKLSEAKIFVLPSLKEHWGVVVLEAAASGCALLLSTSVGSNEDFCESANSRLFKPTSKSDLKKEMKNLFAQDEKFFKRASQTSILKSQEFTPDHFANSVKEVLKICATGK